MFNWIDRTILLVLALFTLVGVLDYVGILPKKIREYFRLNRAEDTLSVLQRMGVDIDQHRRMNQARQYPRTMAAEDIQDAVQVALDQHKISAKIAVGRQRKTAVDYYYDLIGASCDPEYARFFAGILSTYWSTSIEQVDYIKECEFDFVVTPKGGSPTLGYEFAKIVKKPFVLHEGQERFELKGDMRSCFDCAVVPEPGLTALIVDDSTTGGAMVCNAAADLRRFGYKVCTCLVVFEPKSKNARARLAENGMQLISIIQTHQEQNKSNVKKAVAN